MPNGSENILISGGKIDSYNTANNKYISKSDIDNAIAISLKESFMLVAWPVNS